MSNFVSKWNLADLENLNPEEFAEEAREEERRRDKLAADRKAWAGAHPRYCSTCEGWGVLGSGMMDWDTGFVDVDTCPDCIDAGRCPWCGADLPESQTECPCGWTEDAEGMPQVA